MFNYDACYKGGGTLPTPAHQSDVHNLYALLWHQGIDEGLAQQGPYAGPDGHGVRPFLLSRSGTAGIQRYGAAMWSGDIGSNMQSLAAHMNAQMHLSLSGIDYFGADIGGFWRSGLDGDDEGALFSTWLANGALMDVPVRPHTMDNKRHQSTNPALLGDVAGNRQAIRERYALTPYLYTLAHEAAASGEAIFPPLVYHFQEDGNVRTIGHEKMLGQDILIGTITRYDEATQDIYLPRGRWFDFRSHKSIDSLGAWHKGVSNTWQGHVALPMFVRAGAILPLMTVDDATRNTLTSQHQLTLRVYPGEEPSHRELIEDDGLSPEYRQGQLRRTALSQRPLQPQQGVRSAGLAIDIAPASGHFRNENNKRAVHLEVIDGRTVEAVRINGQLLSASESLSLLKTDQMGYAVASGVLHIQTSAQPVTKALNIEIHFAN